MDKMEALLTNLPDFKGFHHLPGSISNKQKTTATPSLGMDDHPAYKRGISL